MNKSIPFNQLDSKLSALIKINDKPYLYFGGTAYLGIPQNKAFINLFLKGIERFGLNNGTSRGNNVQLNIYNEAEAFLAAKFGAEEGLVLSSGYLAAQLCVKAYTNKGLVRYAPNTHPALWLNESPNVGVKSFANWALDIVQEINKSDEKNWVLITNSLNNLYPELYSFSFLSNISSSKNIILIVDDSHGIGLINQGQSALTNIPKLANLDTVLVASMAKALGVDAGVILGSKQAISTLKQADEFYGASPPAAAGLYAYMHANEIYLNELERLQHNVELFKQHLGHKPDWHFDGYYPVFVAKKTGVEEKLLKANILISSFPYPYRNSEKLSRIVLSSWHNHAQINKLLSELG